MNDDKSRNKRSSNRAPQSPEERLRAAIEAYLSLGSLRLLTAYDSEGLHKALMRNPPPEEVTALLRLLAAVLRPLPTEQITRADDVAALLMLEMSHLPQEQVRVVCLDTKNHVQAIETVYQGTVGGTAIRAIEIFRAALRHNSAAIILAHNHPSGDPTPSREDLAVTRQVLAVAKLLGVLVLDHLIIGRGRWLSLLRESPVFEQRRCHPEPPWPTFDAADDDDDLDLDPWLRFWPTDPPPSE